MTIALLAAAGPRQALFQPGTQPQAAGESNYSSLAVDDAGRAHTVWFDATRGVLASASQVAGGWKSEIVDQDGTVGWYASLALDPQGREAVAYYDVSHGALKFAQRVGGAWKAWTVARSEEGAGHYCSLAFDPSGNPGISYYDAGTLSLKYAALMNGVWQLETVDGDGVGTAAAILPTSAPNDPNPPVAPPVENIGLYSSLAFDRTGRPHISYQDVANADLKYAVRTAQGWEAQVVDAAGDVGEHSSLKLDRQGRARIAYYDLQNGALKLATETPQGWRTETVDATGDVGAYASLALDAQDDPHISYLDAGRNALKYATRRGSVWMLQTVDARGWTGRHTSLALDRAGSPVIAYTAAGSGWFRLVSASVQFNDHTPAADAAAAPPALRAWPLPYRGGALNVSFALPAGAAGGVELLDVAGRHVRELQAGRVSGGNTVLAWDGRDDAGRAVPNGVYFLVTRVAGRESRLKLVVTR